MADYLAAYLSHKLQMLYYLSWTDNCLHCTALCLMEQSCCKKMVVGQLASGVSNEVSNLVALYCNVRSSVR